jgi:hypothetical protein
MSGKICIDVAVSAPWSGQVRDVLHNDYSRKQSNYEEWTEFYGLQCLPMVFSIFGNVHRQTRASIEHWESTLHASGFTHGIIVAINKALLHGLTSAVETARHQRKLARSRAQSDTSATNVDASTDANDAQRSAQAPAPTVAASSTPDFAPSPSATSNSNPGVTTTTTETQRQISVSAATSVTRTPS